MSNEIIAAGSAPRLPVAGVDAMALATNLIERVGEWVQIVQTEKTKQADIAAWERTTIAQIRATQDILITYLDRSFDERAETFRRLFDSLDAALARQPEEVSSILGSITTLAMRGPFSDLRDVDTAVQKLKDPGQAWDV